MHLIEGYSGTILVRIAGEDDSSSYHEERSSDIRNQNIIIIELGNRDPCE